MDISKYSKKSKERFIAMLCCEFNEDNDYVDEFMY